jgi:hypothetical protein
VPAAERTMLQYGTVTAAANNTLTNNGHTVQLSIPAGFTPSNASVAIIGARGGRLGRATWPAAAPGSRTRHARAPDWRHPQLQDTALRG